MTGTSVAHDGGSIQVPGERRSWLHRAGRFASQPAPAYADGIIIAFLLCLGLIGAWRVSARATAAWQIWLGVGYLAALIALQMWFFGRRGRARRPSAAAALLLAQVALVYLPILHFPWWLGLPGILAGSMLLLLRPWAAIPLAAAVVVSFGWYGAAVAEGGAAAAGGQVFAAVFDSVTTLMTALVVYGLTRLAELVRDLHGARGELARLAVADERLRFARDLQDLLGVRLSAIAARTERIRALPVNGGTEQVQHELGDVLDTSRKALADVRSVARGYRQLSLDAELAGARSVLAAADVEVQVDREPGELGEPVGTVLAVALREAVTNVLRHGRARRCEIALRHGTDGVRMEVVNDGVDLGKAAGSDGISSIAGQVRGLGGELSANVEPDGRYRLVVRVPHGTPESDSEEVARSGVPAVSRRLANGVVTSVFIAFGTLILADVLINQRDMLQAALGTGYLAVVLGVQVGYFIRPGSRARQGLSLAGLALQGLFVYLPVVQYGGLWLTLPSFLAANALLVLRPVVSVPLTVGVLTSVGWFYGSENPSPLDIAGEVAWVLTNVIAVYGMTRLARLVSELNAARGELARMAVAEERLRFARDVHDLLGLSLSAVTLKAELANRLLVEYPERAREQLAEIAALSRKAIGDVRSVASGYQEFQLSEELRSARSVLSSAEIDVQISGFDFEIPEPQSTVLAAVAREGVTNVLRHSKAERCEITVHRAPDAVRMEIVNDGLTRDRIEQAADGSGNGIRNLIHRVGQVGGDLAVAVDPDGTYRLRATVPLAVAAA